MKRNKSIIKIHQNLKVANINSQNDPALRLGNKTREALQILQKGKMISHVFKACQVLETSTYFSLPCCQSFVHASAATILFDLIKSCNRSTPHQELLR